MSPESNLIRTAVGAILVASLAACGGGGGGGGSVVTPVPPQSANVPVVLSDASSEDWATIGVKVLSIALQPQGGGSPVTVYTAPAPAPMVNLEQLDQIGELLGNVSIPVGTYTGATLTVGANPGDVQLTSSADPEAGFAAPAATSIPAAQIQIQGAQGASGSKTVPVKLTFDAPLVVSTSQSNALDLEFDLGHPAFIVGHVPPALGGATLWAVDFNLPIRRHPIDDIAHLVLRHSYGSVSSVASDGSSIVIAKDLPTLPAASPETAVATGTSLTILADATNGTLFYDVDARTAVTLKSFASESGLTGKYVRVAARYQENGTLVATRIWASSSFNGVWVSPEGHVLHVNPVTNVIVVSNESGKPVALTVDANTQFFFRTPQSAIADATPIGTGPAFLASKNLVRGFKVHASVVDPLATPLVAQTIDIETAAYEGRISAADTTGFTYTRNFAGITDDYTVTLDYIAAASDNGKDSNGNAITGFKYWNFAYPTLVTSGANAVPNFVSATNGGVNFGGSYGAVKAWGVSFARWGDAANPTGWSVPWTVLVPTPLPRATVATGLANNAFSITVPGGTQPATIDVSTSSGSTTLVYQVDRTNGVVTVSAEDITTSAGLTALTNGLAVGAAVKVYGVPQADGTLKAYVIDYFTGDQPAS